ncbi:MAG: hypothetical protein CM15mL7_060 [uncultured marine virus]|nr:MAG: hypothetical protein CM15mL7_060 [uncultured marine virus]
MFIQMLLHSLVVKVEHLDMGAQSAVIGQVAEKALPFAFQQLERERNRQLQTARAVPSLVQTGSQLEDIQRDRQLAPQAALDSVLQYYSSNSLWITYKTNSYYITTTKSVTQRRWCYGCDQ